MSSILQRLFQKQLPNLSFWIRKIWSRESARADKLRTYRLLFLGPSSTWSKQKSSMETQEQRGRSPSVSHMSNHAIRHSPSPSPHGFANPSQQDYLLQTGHQGFTAGNYSSNGLDPNLAFDFQGQLNQTSQPPAFPPHYVLGSNDFGDNALNASAFDANDMNLDGKSSNLKLDTPNHQLNPQLLDSNDLATSGPSSNLRIRTVFPLTTPSPWTRVCKITCRTIGQSIRQTL